MSKNKRLKTETGKGQEAIANKQEGKSLRNLLSIFIIIIISIAIYSNTLKNGFVFDDIDSIVGNYKIRDLSNFYDLSGTRYIGLLSFALNYHFGGLNVFGYHLVNVIIHIINGFLVYCLVFLTFKTPVMQSSLVSRPSSFVIPLTASLIFATHPIQTQAVTYITQRFTSLATLFYLLSLVLYIKARLKMQDARDKMQEIKGEKNLASYFLLLASCISAILAMKTKEISFTLPFIVLLYEFMFFSVFTPRPSSLVPRLSSFKFLIPLLLTLLIIPLSLIGADKPIGDIIGEIREAAQETEEIPRSVYLLTQFRVIVTYIRLLFFPVKQNLDYYYPHYHSFFELKVFLSFLFLLTIFAFAIYLYIRSRRTNNGHGILASFGIFWFFITLSVESSVIPIRDVINEHRLYLPSVGFMIAVSVGLFYLIKERLSTLKAHYPVNLFTGLVCLIVATASIATYQRNKVWRDELSLWSDVVSKSPDKARGHNGLGIEYEKQGQFDEAIKEYKIALTLKPDYPKAHNNLGNAYNKQGRLYEAIKEYLTAIRIKPDFADVHNNLGDAYNKQGQIDDAIKEYLTAIKFKPDMAEAYNNIGNIHYSQGRIDDAIKEYLTAIKFKPDNADFHYNLGNAYRIQGQLDEANKEYLIALHYKPNYWETYNNLGSIYILQGRLEEALKEFLIAVKIKPDSPEAHISLGLAYYKLGQKNRAIEELEFALRLKPDYLPARQALEAIR